jgi:hypothetical protein
VTEFPPLRTICDNYQADNYAQFIINSDTSSYYTSYVVNLYNQDPSWHNCPWLWDQNGVKETAYQNATGLWYNRLEYYVVDMDGNLRFAYAGSISYDPTIVTKVLDELI